jgi:hypothetical protein
MRRRLEEKFSRPLGRLRMSHANHKLKRHSVSTDHLLVIDHQDFCFWFFESFFLYPHTQNI